MSVDSQISELLELIKTSEARNRPARLDDLVSQLGCSKDAAQELLKTALKEDLVEYVRDMLRLTSRGHAEVHRHREQYIHDKYVHKQGFAGRLTRLIEGGVQDWHNHWHRRHGLDENSLRGLYANIRDLEGRVEESVTLAGLSQGEKGVVVFALGGHGIVRRLAEMGLTPGTDVTVLRSAPFHGPIEISVRGVSLALGRGVASKIFVKRAGEVN